MIIDMHGHLNAPAELYAYKAGLLSSRGAYTHWGGLPDEKLKPTVDHHVETVLDVVGTDMQFLSPRPFQLMHSEKAGQAGRGVLPRQQRSHRQER